MIALMYNNLNAIVFTLLPSNNKTIDFLLNRNTVTHTVLYKNPIVLHGKQVQELRSNFLCAPASLSYYFERCVGLHGGTDPSFPGQFPWTIQPNLHNSSRAAHNQTSKLHTFRYLQPYTSLHCSTCRYHLA